MSYGSVPRHRWMALDTVRNDGYAAALGRVVGPDTVVLDLGAGTGIHGLMAARMGARRVYLVEPEDIISVAEEIAEANGLRDRVQCIQGRIEDVSLPEPVDVIVLLSAAPASVRRSALDILAEAPGQRLFKTSTDVDAYLQHERAAWER